MPASGREQMRRGGPGGRPALVEPLRHRCGERRDVIQDELVARSAGLFGGVVVADLAVLLADVSPQQVDQEVVAAGELFGAVVAIEGRPYPASAIAADDGSVWRLAASVARDFCQRYPTLRNAITEQVAVRLRSAHERLRSVALERVEQRLARAVLALAAKIGSARDGHTAISVTRQELADMTGTTVESAIRVTSRWQTSGLIDSARNQIELLDVPGLQSIADGEKS